MFFNLTPNQKEIIKLLPQKALKLVPLSELLKMSTQLVASLRGGEAYEKDVQKRSIDYPLENISFISKEMDTPSNKLSSQEGEQILFIYFSQIFSKNLPIHIDFRSSHFHSENSVLNWRPSTLRYTFDESFLGGVRNLYRGFYENDELLFEKGLFELGMIKNEMNEELKVQIRKIITEHFSEGRSSPIQFSLKKFQNSFDEIFSFFLKNDIRLHPEFALLGVYLVTLYSTLQEIDQALDVKAAFFKAIASVRA